MRLNVGDIVIVMRGKHAGRRGCVTSTSAGPRSTEIAVALDHPVQRTVTVDPFDVASADDPERASMARIRWIRAPGRVASITRTPGGGVYARSEDGRFVVWTRRHLGGVRGERSYRYSFEATDYGVPSGGQRFTTVPIDTTRTESMDVRRVMAAVDAWAAQHPATVVWHSE
jgi:hypothetical protein